MRNNQKIQANKLSESTKTSMLTRVISAIIGVAIVLPCICLGDWFIMALVGFVTVIAIYELIRCAGQLYRFHLFIILMIFAILLTYWPILRGVFDNLIVSFTFSGNWKLFTNFDNIYISIIIIVLAFMVMFFMVLLHSSFTVRDGTFLFTMLIVISLGMQSILYLRFIPMYDHYIVGGFTQADKYFNSYDSLWSSALLVYVALATCMTDIGAYFVGVFFGKHKMNERISPKKTWEGFWGGIIISALCSMAFAFILAGNGHPLMDHVFDLDHWFNIVILSLIMPFISTIGDFVFSSIKRYYDIKDYGKLIPGHGGILDRADSLIFSMITAAIYVNIAVALVNNTNIFL